jgi:hypothetical protein
MAFLDNSGDIILDAVLTDAGRQRMARGNFKITKFALGDEEINYSIFNGSHPSGSAFYDLEVMQTPILEAFTNNTSLMKSKLITMTRNNILFMPMFKLNNLDGTGTLTAVNPSDGYIVLADLNTEQNGKPNEGLIVMDQGLLRGVGTDSSSDKTNHIAIDQGINSNEGGISFKQAIPDDLVETAFLVRIDHRLLTLHAPSGDLSNSAAAITNQFIDDDGIATYYIVKGDNTQCVEGPPSSRGAGARDRSADGRRRDAILNPRIEGAAKNYNEVFEGPLGSILRIYPKASMHVQASSALFTEIGTTVASGSDITLNTADSKALSAYKYIDTLINVVGVTTGYSIDVPIRIVKKS